MPSGTFKIADLGLANLEKSIDHNTIVAEWMIAPEVLNSADFGKIGRTMDIYHTALMLMEIIAGEQLTFTHEDILKGVPRKTAESLGSPFSMALSRA